tara:strand:- start:974 stop:1135 length:162 start_codon:yes stop_codon:yes gene_type:complete
MLLVLVFMRLAEVAGSPRSYRYFQGITASRDYYSPSLVQYEVSLEERIDSSMK